MKFFPFSCWSHKCTILISNLFNKNVWVYIAANCCHIISCEWSCFVSSKSVLASHYHHKLQSFFTVNVISFFNNDLLNHVSQPSGRLRSPSESQSLTSLSELLEFFSSRFDFMSVSASIRLRASLVPNLSFIGMNLRVLLLLLLLSSLRLYLLTVTADFHLAPLQ